MSDFTFDNVTITVNARDAHAAYAKLCKVLADNDLEFKTDTFHEGVPGRRAEHRDTSELWPEEQETPHEGDAGNNRA